MTELGRLARLFLRLGLVAFGGPATHIAMLEDEVVARRRWLARPHFLDLVGATNLIPGPNSTEMAMHVGYERAGAPGLLVAGASFIAPAALLTAGLAWLYVRFGTLPALEPFLYGVRPAVLAVIVAAVWRLGRHAVKDARLAVVGAGVTASVLLGADEVGALIGGGLLGMLWLRRAAGAEGGALLLAVRPPDGVGAGRPPGVWGDLAVTAGAVAAAGGVSVWKLGLFFLKVGAVLYGSGYVLVAFLEGGLVGGYGWLSRGQLLDAIAIGQVTPGPVLTTATFVGYVLAGAPGAIVATVAIFLPSVLFVLVLNPVVPRLRRSAWASAFLDSVNVAAVALMLAVAVELGASTLTTWPAWTIGALAAAAAWRFAVNPAWLVVGGAAAGWLLRSGVG